MGLVTAVVPLDQLEDNRDPVAREILKKAPPQSASSKLPFNAATDGLAGLQQSPADATLLYYLSEEAKEARTPF